MFIPCGEDGNFLEEPKEYFDWYKWGDFSKYGKSITPKCKEYHKAKERCLFDKFVITEESFIHDLPHFYLEIDGIKIMWNFNNKWVFYKGFKTIEDLVKHKPELTPTALKTLGL